MTIRLKALMFALAAQALAASAVAQDLVGESADETTQAAEGTASAPPDFFQQLISSYTQWDVFKVGWFVATLVFGYGIATIAYRAMLGDRRATTAGKMGCFFGALAFLGINLLTFGLIMYESPNWLGWAAAAVLLIIVFALLFSRKKVRA